MRGLRIGVLAAAMASVSALLPALGATTSINPRDYTSYVPSNGKSGKGGRSGNKPGKRYRSSTFHIDHQRQASLRRRMGGNAMRIQHARQGRIFDESSGAWTTCPHVLYEEVEAVLQDYLSGTNYRGRVFFRIRDKTVSVEHPFRLGPIDYSELNA